MCASGEGSGETVQLHSLTKALAVRLRNTAKVACSDSITEPIRCLTN